MELPSFADVVAAAERIRPHIHRTPVVTSASLDRMAGARLFFKCENLQKVGAFKARGAANAVLALAEELSRRGVATHSSGNHAAALARAAGLRGVPAHIVMPSSASTVKRRAVEGYGGLVTTCAPTLAAREEALSRVVAATGATFVHPYNNPLVIAGQGTATVELLEDLPDLDVLLVPVGGGGLASGSALAAAGLAPRCRVVGAEPAVADDARRSLEADCIVPAGDPVTVADGLRTSLGELTFAVLRRHLEAILTAGEEEIVAAMRQLWERTKLLVEPSSAVPLAALLAAPTRFSNQKVGIILSGGNVDLDNLPW